MNTSKQTLMVILIFRLWEAHKEVIRSNLMSLNSNNKRKKQEKLKSLQETIKRKENELKKRPDKNINIERDKGIAGTNIKFRK